MPEPSLLLIGHLEGEMPAEAADWIGHGGSLQQVDDVDAAAGLLAAETSIPDLMILAEARPGATAAASIDALRRLAPLARVWRLLGSWCEGEARSGHPPGGCVSTYWHQWSARWAQEAERSRDGNPPAWTLPVTMSPDERLLASAERPIETRAGLIAVCARHAQTAAALEGVCQMGGYTPLILREGQSTIAAGAVAVLWDADVQRMTDPASVRHVRACAGQAPLLALVNFPRVDDCQRAAEAGVAGVISKPFLVADLLWHLARVTS